FGAVLIGVLCRGARADDVHDEAVAIPPFATARAATPEKARVARADLQARIDRRLADPALKKAVIGLAVKSVNTGETLAEVAADQPLIVASNNKLFTANAAFRWLGADHRFTTRVLATGLLGEDGTLQGDLVVIGGGDPDAV